MKSSKLAFSLYFGALFLGIISFERGSAAPQAGDRQATLSINTSRPLAAAADFIQLKFGVMVSYEDAVWAYGGDIVRAVDAPYNIDLKQERPEAKANIPVGGSLEIKIPLDPILRRPTDHPSELLQSVLNQHGGRGNPGRFQLISLGDDGFSIVPRLARNARGRFEEQQSPLDIPIWIPDAERDGMATLKTICETLTAASGGRIVIGTVPINLLFNTVVRLGANGEPARVILLTAFHDLHWADASTIGELPMLCWRLFYGPDTHDYVLNLKVVERELISAAGSIQRQIVTRNR